MYLNICWPVHVFGSKNLLGVINENWMREELANKCWTQSSYCKEWRGGELSIFLAEYFDNVNLQGIQQKRDSQH